jgi:hypothetical protein
MTHAFQVQHALVISTGENSWQVFSARVKRVMEVVSCRAKARLGLHGLSVHFDLHTTTQHSSINQSVNQSINQSIIVIDHFIHVL